MVSYQDKSWHVYGEAIAIADSDRAEEISIQVLKEADLQAAAEQDQQFRDSMAAKMRELADRQAIIQQQLQE